MVETTKTYTVPLSIELAAGGLVWSGDSGDRRLAVVRRSQYGDWVLPKGRLGSNEAADRAALREVMEETRRKADLGMWAGSYSYQKKDRAKVVLMWEATALPDPYDHPAPSEEIDQVAWLTPAEALTRLSYSRESEFLARHMGLKIASPVARTDSMQIDTNYPRPFLNRARLDRLRAAVKKIEERCASILERSPNGGDAWWARSAKRSLRQAKNGVDHKDLEMGWGALHNAERAMVFGMNHRELLARAATLYSETQRKLKGWRRDAAEALLKPFTLHDWNKSALDEAQKPSLQFATEEAMRILYEDNDNTYHRARLVQEQLIYLVLALVLLLSVVIIAALESLPWGANPNSSLHIGNLLAVALAGALGGTASAMFQLSRIGKARIPEGVVQGFITSGRPLVGAVFALFVYVVMKSNVVGFISIQNPSLEAGLALGFVAGFSERLVISTVARVAGQDRNNPGSTNPS